MGAMSLQAVMKLDSSGFTNPLNGLRNTLGGTIKNLAALAGIGVSVAGTIAGLRNALNMGGELSELSQRTGIAVGELVILRQAFVDTGVGAESGVQAITLMQKSLSGMNEEGQPTNKMFAQLGLNMEALTRLGTGDQLQTIGKAIMSLKDPAQQTAASMAIFGRSGASMKQFFSDPAAIQTATKSLGSMPTVLARNAELFDAIGDAMGRIKTKATGFFVGIMDGIAPAMKGIVDSIDGIDFTALGVKVGQVIGTLTEVFKEGKLGQLISLNFRVGVAEAVNYITGTLGNLTFWSGIIEVALAAFGALAAGLASILLGWIPGMKAAMADLMADSADLFKGGMEDIKAGFKSSDLIPVDDLKAQISGIWATAAGNLAKNQKDLQSQNKDNIKTGNSTLSAPAGKQKKAPEVSTDSLARIGGFVGVGSMTLDPLRRTATHTEHMAKTLDKMHAQMRTTSPGSTTWGI